jgi:hypothetical protein
MFLEKFPVHWHTFVGAIIASHLVYVLGDIISSSISSSYRNLCNVKKIDWGIRIVSIVHATLITLLALPIFFIPTLQNAPIFGYTYYSGTVYAITCG